MQSKINYNFTTLVQYCSNLLMHVAKEVHIREVTITSWRPVFTKEVLKKYGYTSCVKKQANFTNLKDNFQLVPLSYDCQLQCSRSSALNFLQQLGHSPANLHEVEIDMCQKVKLTLTLGCPSLQVSFYQCQFEQQSQHQKRPENSIEITIEMSHHVTPTWMNAGLVARPT